MHQVEGPRAALAALAHRAAWLRPLPLILLAVLLLRPSGASRTVVAETDRARALVLGLQERGLLADAADVRWIDAPRGAVRSRFAEARAMLRAHRPDEPADVYLATARLSPEGRLLELTGVYNLSDTSAVDERALTISGTLAAWAVAGDGAASSFRLAELAGEPPPTGEGWTRRARFQSALTNLQETGQLAGIGLRTFRLQTPAERLALSFDGPSLEVDADGRKIRIPTTGGAIEGQRFVEELVTEKARPGNLVTWAVDRVRGLSWFGSDRMQLVKAVAFAGLDWIERLMGAVTGDTGAERVQEELGGVGQAPLAEYTDPETGWPPAPMQPMLSPPLEGEGKWRALDQDPFVLTNPGAPSPFLQSFVRTDRDRPYTQIWVMLWDPRQVSLHTMSGTVEPKSATGETGPGLVPRKPEVLGRLVAAFNGGFQAQHGEFGMMADGVVYLPPKPFGATVAELDDGSTGFGTWPHDDRVPEQVVSFRQNMTPLVMDETVNPYKRNWWGGVPPGWTDESRTVRTAICLTKEHFVAYLYGTSIDADHLALAMQRARCVYGIHLDMNPGHTGLELYRTGPESELPRLDRKLDPKWEAEGSVSGIEGWRFRGRRMLRYMGLMNFPRYIQRESRDFVYLTLRHLLPGPNLPVPITPAEAGEGEWKTKGLPQHGWPYALATTSVRPDPARADTKVTVLAIDPAVLRVATEKDADAPTVLALPAPAPREGPALWLGSQGFAVSDRPPEAAAARLAEGHASPAPGDLAALGVSPTGTLLYAEVSSARDPSADGHLLAKLLKQLGCGPVLYLGRPLGAALGGEADLSGRRLPPPAAMLRLIRRPPPGARRIFTDTPIVPVSVWYPLQAKRVRYFPKPKKEEGQSGSSPGDKAGEASPAAAGSAGRRP